MEFAFSFTPGLHLFVANQANSIAATGTDVTMFYSVTVLTLFGHLPGALLVGLLMSQRYPEGETLSFPFFLSFSHPLLLDVEFSISFAAITWLVLALSSVGLLIAHIVLRLGPFLHGLVVLSLILGSMVRLTGILSLPYAYLTNGDPLFASVWWWLLCGIDWPQLTVSAEIVVELLALLLVAQVVENQKRRFSPFTHHRIAQFWAYHIEHRYSQ